MSDLTTLRNIGPVSAGWLEAIGVTHPDQLAELGAVETYLRILDLGVRANLNLLYALQGAILDLPWNGLPPSMVQALRREVDASTAEASRG